MELFCSIDPIKSYFSDGLLGHLLLGKGAHSAAGIMHTPCRARDLELTREGAMSFLPAESKRIRAQVLARAAKKQSAVIRQAAAAQKNTEILECAANIYEALKNYDCAQTLFENAFAIRAEQSGQRDSADAAGLVKLGDLSPKRRQYDEADAFHAKAVALGDQPEVASALFHPGIRSYGEGNVQAALDFSHRRTMWSRRERRPDPRVRG